jgi:hypothetical protein
MIHQNDESIPDYMDSYDPMIRPFAWKVLQGMTAASHADNKRLHGQLLATYSAIDRLEIPKVWPFWSPEAKAIAAEWSELRAKVIQARADRAAYLRRLEEEDRARQTADAATVSIQAASSEPVASTPAAEEVVLQEVLQSAPSTTPATEAAPDESSASSKAKREYRKIEYVPGQNPFRAGSKNAKIFDLLLAGGRTKEQLAQESGADLKSVGYIIWLCKRSGLEVLRYNPTKSYRLVDKL